MELTDAPVASTLTRAAYALGGTGLLLATATDALAVAGRHLGIPLLGSIELVQAAVVLLTCSAMLIVTIRQGHAAVHMAAKLLSPARAELLQRAAMLVSALVFAELAYGSAWVLVDLWNGFEQTELLHIPLRWLRLIWVIAAILIAGQFARQALKR